MEYQTIKVKAQTLNKNLFNQLRDVKQAEIRYMPLLVGWVSTPDRPVTRWLIAEGEQFNNALVRIDIREMFYLWSEMNKSKLANTTLDEQLKAYSDFVYTLPQIFI